ncbi:MAG: hypothetical protein IJ623_08345 [Bacteroidales bacterium]|nr:hypothetical protein [Bacteroidales bacterium]
MSFRDRIRTRASGLGREWIILIISIFLACLVWLLSNLSKEYSGTVSVPVVAESNIEGHGTESSNTVLVSARCRVEGFRLIREYSRRERKVVKVRFDRADLRRTGPDEYCVIGGSKNSYVTQLFGEGAHVEAFITDTLRFFFPVENHKRVPVEVPRQITFRSQYMPSGPFSVSPDSVTVYGEESRLLMIDRLTTPRLVLGDVMESRHGVLRLNIPEGIRASTDQVSYEQPVSRYVELQTVVPVEAWNVPAGHHLQVYPATAKVMLRCAFPLSRDPLPSFRLYVDWKDFTSSLTGRCVPRTLLLPSGVLEYKVEPEVFDCVEVR